MNPDSILAPLAGGSVLVIIVGLAGLLIRQVMANGKVNESQTTGWERLVKTSQGDADIARSAIAGMTVEIERLEAELAEMRRERERCRREHRD